MILSDVVIRQLLATKILTIDPFDDAAIQPASVDVHLSSKFRVYRNHKAAVIDPRERPGDMMELVDVGQDGFFILHPGEFALAVLRERIGIHGPYVGRLEGKSSLARLGLLIHMAGFVDPGFDGEMTLELANLANLPIKLYAGMKIGQMSYLATLGVPSRYYGDQALGSRYQGQQGPTESRFYQGEMPGGAALPTGGAPDDWRTIEGTTEERPAHWPDGSPIAFTEGTMQDLASWGDPQDAPAHQMLYQRLAETAERQGVVNRSDVPTPQRPTAFELAPALLNVVKCYHCKKAHPSIQALSYSDLPEEIRSYTPNPFGGDREKLAWFLCPVEQKAVLLEV